MQMTIVRLGDEAGNGEAGGIGMERDIQIWIEVTENRSRGERRLQRIEGGLRSRVPFESLTLAKKRGDRHDDARVSIDESAVEIGKT